jgi:hypothetical protein
MEQWDINFERDINGFFRMVTRWYDEPEETEGEFRTEERHRNQIRASLRGKTTSGKARLLVGVRVLLAKGTWRDIEWGDQETYYFNEDPEFLQRVLEILVEETAAVLPADAIPVPLNVTISLGGGALHAPLDSAPDVAADTVGGEAYPCAAVARHAGGQPGDYAATRYDELWVVGPAAGTLSEDQLLGACVFAVTAEGVVHTYPSWPVDAILQVHRAEREGVR